MKQGLGNLVGSFFSCAPFAASLSRSALQESVGGKTQLASLVSCSILLAVLLWIGPFFELLPRVSGKISNTVDKTASFRHFHPHPIFQCILASLIIVALKSILLQVTRLPHIWKLSMLDGIVWIITYVTVILVEIDVGLLVGLGFSILSLLIQGIKPYTCVLSRVPGTDIYVDKSKYSHVS